MSAARVIDQIERFEREDANPAAGQWRRRAGFDSARQIEYRPP
jgi:hypothetical protein